MGILTNAVRDFAGANELAFRCGFAEQMTESPLEFPMIWAEPPVLCGKKGRNEGTLRYKIRLHILQRNENYSPLFQERIWEGLEKTALRLYEALAVHPKIASTENITCTPARSALTNYGELSVPVTFEAEILYCESF